MVNFFNTRLSQQQFLQQYWQKKPLLIRQAFSDFQSPISPEELAGLACEPDIESRLIEERGQNGKAWQVTMGPLSEDDFSRLPETHWTMLVQDVDKHLPELQYLLDPFRFIPDWRRDDLMVSYATESGSVGPHTDAYDVFLLQAQGTRRWQIGGHAITQASLIDGLPLQILAEFTPDQSWDLQPGDLLYLPPHFAHHGVALNECMTFSVGFRAPAGVDMLDGLIDVLLEQGVNQLRYQDADLLVNPNSAEIDRDALVRLRHLLHQTIDQSDSALAIALGKFVSETKPSLVSIAAEAGSDLLSIDELNIYFEQGHILQRNLYYRFAWTRSDRGGQLFMAGECYTVTTESVRCLPVLAENKRLNGDDWQVLKQDRRIATILCQLVAEGGWFWGTGEG